MVEESSRAERARQERVHEQPKEPVRPKPREGDFKEVFEKSRMPSQPMPQTSAQSRLATEQAIREAMRQEDRSRDDREKKDKDRDEGRDSRQDSKESQGRLAGKMVIAKGKLKQGSQGSGGRQGGFGQAAGRRSLTRVLTKAGAKSIPSDLQGKFASRLAQAMKTKGSAEQARLAQQILNKLIQYVRIGINRKGEKEMRIDLHERIFRGLKLRVIARGGKVGVYFSTMDRRGRKVLNDSKDEISRALEDKGIEVDEIVVS